MTLYDPTAEELTAALAKDGVLTVIVKNAGSNLSTDSFAVGSGRTLVIQSGVFTVGSGQTLEIQSGGTLTIEPDATLYVGDSSALKPGELIIQDGGTLNNYTDFLLIDETMGYISNDGTFINSGNFWIPASDRFTCRGTYQENRDGFYALAKDTEISMVYYLGPADSMGEWYSNTTVTLLGAKTGTVSFLPSVNVSGAILDLNGRTLSMRYPLMIAMGKNESSDLIIGTLTITDSSQSRDGVLQFASTDGIIVEGGTLTVSGGTIISESGQTINDDGTVTNNGGTAILVNSGSVEITGGTVKGAVYGIQNRGSGTVTISGGTVLLTAENPKESKYFTMSGPFAFEGGTLMAKDLACLFDNELILPDGKELLTEENEDGYFRATLTP